MPALRRLFATAVIATTLTAGVACGGDTGADATPTPLPYGPTPVLGGNVLAVVPAHGTSMPQAATKTADPREPKPPCFSVDFTGLPEQGQWFRVFLDGVEVTTRLTWVIQENPRPDVPPRACYATEEGLSIGRHTMTVRVRDPRNATAADRQVVSWTFDVLR